jgi:hypothetical protein
MPQCTAITTKRVQCTAEGTFFENLCTRHFNLKRRNDAEYRARYEAYLATEETRRREAEAERARLAAEQAAQRRAAEEARRAAEAAARRTEKIAKRTRHLAEVPTLSPIKILDHARKVVELWNVNNVPGYDIPKAYAALAYNSSRHDGFIPLMTAVVKLRFQAFSNHPDFVNYRDVPEAERNEVLAEIRTTLAPYGEIDLLRVVTEGDSIRGQIVARQQLEEAAARRAAALEAERVRLAAFRAQDRAVPVVFQRDPEGGINLRAFATDTQSVHRSSVQNSTHKAVVALLNRAPLEGVNALEEAVEAFNDPRRVRWYGNGPTQVARTAAANGARDAAITELTNDYFNTEAFSVRYGAVVDRVWAFVRGHEHHNELCERLAQEVYEGRGMCSNGKMARLVNVLQGYDETLMTEAPREVFQFRMAALRNQPLASREAVARELFREFSIPEEEQEAWLEPLLEPEDEPSTAAGGGAAAAAAAPVART